MPDSTHLSTFQQMLPTGTLGLIARIPQLRNREVERLIRHDHQTFAVADFG